MKKLSNTEAELKKKRCLLKTKTCFFYLGGDSFYFNKPH